MEKAILKLREALKCLLRTPDLNLESLEDDTITGIEIARDALAETEVYCPLTKMFKQKE